MCDSTTNQSNQLDPRYVPNALPNGYTWIGSNLNAPIAVPLSTAVGNSTNQNNVVSNIAAGISTSILSLGDSTEAGITTWTYPFFLMLMAKYPAYNYNYLAWNSTNQTYDPPVFLSGAQNSRYLAMTGGQSGLFLPSSDVSPITSDMDLRAYVQSTNYASGIIQTLISKYQGGVEVSFRFNITTDGHLQLMWSADGLNQIIKVSTVTLASAGITNGQDIWLKATLTLNNGASGNDVKFYYSTNNITYTQLGATVTTAGTTSVYFGALTNWELGTTLNSANSALVGNYYYAEIRNGLNGPILSPYSLESWCRYLVTGAVWTGAPLLTMFLGGQPGIALTGLLDATRIKTMVPYNEHALIMMSCGHNDGNSHGTSYMALWDSWLAAVRGRIKTGDFWVVTQNPDIRNTVLNNPYEEQSRRQGEIGSWGLKNSLRLVDFYTVMVNTPNWQSLIQSDNTHPTTAGYLLWAQTTFKAIFGS